MFYPCDRQQSLVEKTMELIKTDERSLSAISMKAEVPFYWLQSFAAGKISNPGVNRVQYLYEFLTGKKLIEG